MEVMKIAFVPIDNRPVCYQLPKMIADINPDAELLIPPIEYLGDLHKTANVEGLFDWLKNLSKVDAFVLSLDTIACLYHCDKSNQYSYSNSLFAVLRL